MENKTFDDFLTEVKGEVTTVETTEEETVTEDLDIESADEVEEGLDEITEEVEESTEEATEPTTAKDAEDRLDFKAFAEMRTKTKQLEVEKQRVESELQKAEALAKKLKYESIDDMLAEAERREMMEEAKKAEVPVEYLERMKKLEQKDRERDAEIERIKFEQKEVSLIETLDSISQKNSLSEKDFTDALNAMDADGFKYETLLELPKSAISKIVESYIHKEVSKQKQLEQKVKLQQEIPMTPKEKNDGVIPSKIDDLFMVMSGQKRDF